MKAPPRPADEESGSDSRPTPAQHTPGARGGGLIHHNDAIGQQDFEFKPTHDQEGQKKKDDEKKEEQDAEAEAAGRDDGAGRRRSSFGRKSTERRRSSFRRNSFARRASILHPLGRVKSDGEVRDEQDPEGLTREATEELDGHFILEQALHIPRHLEVSYEEMAVLRGLRERMSRGGEVIIEDGEPPEIIGRTTSRG